MSAKDIMKQYPDIVLKRDVPVKDIHGSKAVIPKGEAPNLKKPSGISPFKSKGLTGLKKK